MKTLTINQLSSYFYREHQRSEMRRVLKLRKDVMHYKELQDSRKFELARIQEVL